MFVDEILRDKPGVQTKFEFSVGVDGGDGESNEMIDELSEIKLGGEMISQWCFEVLSLMTVLAKAGLEKLPCPIQKTLTCRTTRKTL